MFAQVLFHETGTTFPRAVGSFKSEICRILNILIFYLVPSNSQFLFSYQSSWNFQNWLLIQL